jgi:acyl-CoA synthetase (AMP-forming)/AMP-acid ligase II
MAERRYLDAIHRVNLGDLLVRSAARAPLTEAVVDGDRRLTYRALNEWVNRTAHGLAALGYGAGDALALMSRNSAEFLVTYFACAKLGVICVPINLLWRQGELAFVLTHARVRGVIVEADLMGQLAPALDDACAIESIIVIGKVTDAEIPRGLQPLSFADLGRDHPATEPEAVAGDRDPISYLYTSGTTAAPKGVVSSHLAIYLESLGVAIDMRMTAADRMAAMLPLFHTAQLNALCTPALAVGATIVILRGFDAETLLDHQTRRPRDVSSLRMAIYAMAPMAVDELRRAITVFGCDFSLLFGQTEMSPVSAFFRPEHQLSHPGAAGTPSINVQVAIMDEDGNLLTEGQSGEIVYRSPQVLNGYLYDPGATDHAFRHGWFHSGDRGHFDQDGILWFEDRFKDVIKSGGENVSSLEVETALYAAEPDILEAAVVGLPHDRWGEAITALVVPRPERTIDCEALLAALRNQLSPYKCPKAVIVTESFPKTATGKIQKVELRKYYQEFYRNTDGQI